jgi:hypothetical protein
MRRSHHFVATCFAIIALGTSAVAAGAEVRASAGSGDVVEITDLQPFTHAAINSLSARRFVRRIFG